MRRRRPRGRVSARNTTARRLRARSTSAKLHPLQPSVTTPWSAGMNPSGQMVSALAMAPTRVAVSSPSHRRSAPRKTALSIRARPTFAPRKMAPVKSASTKIPLRIMLSVRSARTNFAWLASQAAKLACDRFARSRFALSRHPDRSSAPEKLAPIATCSTRRARCKFIPEKFAPMRVSPSTVTSSPVTHRIVIIIETPD